jgi:hypothetical protein
MYMQIVHFQLKGLSDGEFRAQCDQLAPQWAAISGLISKVWLANPATNTYGGVYTWESRQAMERFVCSDLFADVAANPHFANVTSTDFGVLEGPTRTTSGLPAAAAVAA